MYRVDISADLNDDDGSGCIWTFLDEARDPALVKVGALLVAGDEDAAAMCAVAATRSRAKSVKHTSPSCAEAMATIASSLYRWPNNTSDMARVCSSSSADTPDRILETKYALRVTCFEDPSSPGGQPMNVMQVLRRCLWRGTFPGTYGCGMGVARRSPRIEPVRRPTILDTYAGQWVAVKDGRVIAHGFSPRDVVVQMRQMGRDAHGAVLQRSPEPTEALAVGLG
jgi:Family of unknown function (DUF5678)